MAGALDLLLADEAATMRLGEDFSAVLRRGDVLALSGDLGAGKSTLARALIRALAGLPDLEVPSPTFTLVQDYPTEPPVFHFDLYRLGNPGELEELGFEDSSREGVVLVEWPEKAENRLPQRAVTVALAIEGAGRASKATAPSSNASAARWPRASSSGRPAGAMRGAKSSPATPRRAPTRR